MIADAEEARGIAVKHVMSETVATRHELTGFAVVRRMQKRGGGAPVITYPGVSEAIAIPRKIRR